MGLRRGYRAPLTGRDLIRLFGIYIAFTFLICGAQVDDDDDLISTLVVEAVEGQTVGLPCDIAPRSNQDMVYMVLWFLTSVTPGGKPLYSFDVRGRSMHYAIHCPADGPFGNRSTFRHKKIPAELEIRNIQADDAGVYRCRVDFKNSPTRNYQIRLVVVVPPHHMLMIDEKGNDVAGKIGPLEVGDNFTVYCEIWGGNPKPILQWLVDGIDIKDYIILKSDELVTISKITMTDAKRSWLDTKVCCRAISTESTEPSQRSAVIHMNLEPTSVRITNKRDVKMVAGKDSLVICEVNQSWPPAKIEWFINNVLYTAGEQQHYFNNSMTMSKIYMTPASSENGYIMKCQATHPTLGHVGEDFFIMDVIHVPEVTLKMGNKVNENMIREGEDVYFECHIVANPTYNRVTWFYNNMPVSFKNVTRVYSNGKSLVLRDVTRKDIGLYTCRSANDVGETRSNSVYLRIQYPPECAQPNPIVIGANLDELLRVRCTVDADPDNVTFDWKFNNSKDKFQVSPARFINIDLIESTTSELRYRAATDRDYGTLLCSAENEVGEQLNPCVFHIVPPSKYSTRPAAPHNCSISNTTWAGEEYLSVRCLANYDGGLQQHFTLGTVQDKTRVIYNNSQAQYYAYMIKRQLTCYSYEFTFYTDNVVWLNVSWSVMASVNEGDVLAVYSHNSRGQSEATPLSGLEFWKPKLTEMELPTEDLLPYPTETAIAVLIVMAVLVAAVVAVLTFKRRRNQPTPIPKPTTTAPTPLQTVIQVDGQGRRQMSVTYPTEDPTAAASRPAILTSPETDGRESPQPPRVILNCQQKFTSSSVTYRLSINEGASASSLETTSPENQQVVTMVQLEQEPRDRFVCTRKHRETDIKETIV